MIYAVIETPPGSPIERTNEVAHQLLKIAEKEDGVESVSSLAGFEILSEGTSANSGSCLINLKDWKHRKRTAKEIIRDLEDKCKAITTANIDFFEPPSIPGYGAASGFEMRLLDKTGNNDYHQMEKVSKEHEVAKRLTSVEASRVRALRRLLKPVLAMSGQGKQLPKSSYWLRIYVLITVAIAGIVVGQLSGFFEYLKLFIACLVTLQVKAAIGYLAFIWPLALLWGLVIAVFVTVWLWHRRETFKEWKELLALADREVEEWSQTTAVSDEVAELQKFLKKAHKYY